MSSDRTATDITLTATEPTENQAGAEVSAVGALDALDEMDFLLEEVENKIAPLALA